MGEDLLRPTGRWFYRRGLPTFVEDYRNSTDVWTRASPVLAVIFVLSMTASAASFEDVPGALVGVALVVLVLGGYVVVNRLRGRRWYALPERVTWPWLVGFVVLPALATYATSRSVDGLLPALVGDLFFLGIVWVVTRYAVIPLLGWAVRYTVRGLGDLYRLSTRALPLMLLFIVFLFLTTELWQVTGTLSASHLWVVIGLFVVLGVAFVLGRVPDEIRLIDAATTREQVIEACSRTPLAPVAADLPGLGDPVPLRLSQRANIGLVMTVAQLVQVALFAVVMWAFLVVFGTLAVSLQLQGIWLGEAGTIHVIWTWADGYGLTHELLRLSLFLAAFSAFYVTIYAAIDATYREHFFDGIRRDVERSMSVRRAYLALRRQT